MKSASNVRISHPLDLRTAAPPGETLTLTAVHRTVVVVDVEGFGDYRRTNTNRVRVRDGLYRAMRLAFDAAGVPWDDCDYEDRGDGILVLVSAGVPKALFVDVLPDTLAGALLEHNRTHPTEERIRLRLALHAGEVTYDDHGVTGTAINLTYRILDADVLRAALADSLGVLAIAGSAWFYDEVIRHSELSRAGEYRSVAIASKETATRAWIRLAGAAVPAPRRRS